MFSSKYTVGGSYLGPRRRMTGWTVSFSHRVRLSCQSDSMYSNHITDCFEEPPGITRVLA